MPFEFLHYLDQRGVGLKSTDYLKLASALDVGPSQKPPQEDSFLSAIWINLRTSRLWIQLMLNLLDRLQLLHIYELFILRITKSQHFSLRFLHIVFVKCQISGTLDKYLRKIYSGRWLMLRLANLSRILTWKAPFFGRHFVCFLHFVIPYPLHQSS